MAGLNTRQQMEATGFRHIADRGDGWFLMAKPMKNGWASVRVRCPVGTKRKDGNQRIYRTAWNGERLAVTADLCAMPRDMIDWAIAELRAAA